MRKVTRERQHGTGEKSALYNDGSRVWLWAIDTGGRDLELKDLQKLWDDFTPGFTSGVWYVDGTELNDSVAGSDFRIVTQSWRRVETENPLLKAFKWTGMESLEIEIPAFYDDDGKPVATTAGEPIIGMTSSQLIWRFTGERNIPGIPSWLANYGRSTNGDTVRIGTVAIPPNCLQLQKVRIGDEDDSTKIAGRTIIFRKLELELWWNPETWNTPVLNMGFYELRNIGTRAKAKFAPVRMTNDGQPVDTPQFLNKAGFRPRDKEGNVKALIDPDEIHVLHFNFNKRKPYSVLFR